MKFCNILTYFNSKFEFKKCLKKQKIKNWILKSMAQILKILWIPKETQKQRIGGVFVVSSE